MAEESKDDEMKEFDVIVLGTGLKECILSGLLSASGKKVLHLDRNSYYGGDSASLNLDQLYEQFKDGDAKAPQEFGRVNDYCVDLSPKFLMACGDLVKILVKTKVSEYLDFTSIQGSFVYNQGKLHKVPSTAREALGSGMLGLMDKNRFRSFLQYIAQYEENDPATHKWGYDLKTMTARELYKKFSLGEKVQTFTGHAIALHLDDSYLDKPALDLVLRAQLYAWSANRYGKGSPYLYPKYGLGGIPEGFSRRCAVHGGTFMLNMGKVEPFVEEVKYADDGKVSGIVLGVDVCKAYDLPSAFIKCKQLVADPTYFKGTNKVEKFGEVAHRIAIMSHPVPNTNDVDSCQLILPASQVGRKSDIYVCMTSGAQSICPKNKYMACMSTNRAASDADADLKPAMNLLGKVDESFTWTTKCYKPVSDGTADQCFITTSVDATTHFATSSEEVLAMYERITGELIDLEPEEEQKEQ
jgi:Rab GDP dissociation inhibitor